jgi:hypothetical protein
MDDISEQLAIRDRFRRKLALRKTPQERMRDMARLQEAAKAEMLRSPEGYAHFLRRNFRARSISGWDHKV